MSSIDKNFDLEDFAKRVMMPTRLAMDLITKKNEYSHLMSVFTKKEFSPKMYEASIISFAHDSNRDLQGFKDFIWTYRNLHLRQEYEKNTYIPLEPLEKEHLSDENLNYVLDFIKKEYK